jgi:hypothetical protein
MRSVRALCISLSLVAACGSDDPGDVAGVFPEEGFIGRTLRVEVTGDTTSWGADSAVNFGDGITVSGVEVISPQALQVDLAINPAAVAGAQDVTVTSGGDTLTLPGAFTLVSPVAVDAPGFEQGGLGGITISNLDLLNPFDDTLDPDTFEFSNVTVTSTDPGVQIFLSNVTKDEIFLSAQIDVTATTTGTITVTSTTDGVATVTQLDPVAVTARTPQAITAGTDANFTMAANGSLLEVTATQAGLLNLRLTTADTELALGPGFVVLPASGKWSELISVHQNFGDTNLDAAILNQEVAAGDKFFIVALESPFGGFFTGSPGYAATFASTEISLAGVTPVVDTGDNDAKQNAQALTGAIAVFDGTLTSITDVDCFKIPTTAANQRIHVYTTDDNTNTDTVVEVFSNDTAAGTSIAASTDADFGEDLVTDALVAPLTRSICVSASEFAPKDLANATYSAIVVIENP